MPRSSNLKATNLRSGVRSFSSFKASLLVKSLLNLQTQPKPASIGRLQAYF